MRRIYKLIRETICQDYNIIVALQLLAIIGGLLPLFWLDVRIEYDDGWFTTAAYEWAFHGVPRIPAFAGSGADDEVIHALWPMVSGSAAIFIKLLSGLMPIVVCARLPMIIASLTAILLLGIQGSKIFGQLAAWAAAALLALDSVVFLNARTVRPEALLLPIFVWVLLQLMIVLDGKSNPFNMLGIGVILGAGWFLFHQNSIVVPGLMLGSALLFSGNRKLALRALLWTGLGIAFGFTLYCLIGYYTIGNHAFKGEMLQGVGKLVMNSSKEHSGYLNNGLALIKKWCVFPYRAVLVACAVMAAYGSRKDTQKRFLIAASISYLMVYTVGRASENMRYMAYISFMLSPLVGTALAHRKVVFRPSVRKLFVGIYILTLASGLGNIYEIWRLRPASATNLRAMIETSVPSNSTIVGSLWIGGVVPERKLILDIHFPNYFVGHKQEQYYIIEDGLYGAPTKNAVIFLEKNGWKCRDIVERPLPRLKYIRVSKVVRASSLLSAR